jgi:hypothetical protein
VPRRQAQLARLHYKNKALFPFEKYFTRLYDCFEALEDNEQGYRNAQKVKQMLENVTSSDVEVIALKTVIRKNYSNDFAMATTHMAAQIALIFPAAQSDICNKRPIGAMDSRGGGRAGRGRGRRTTMVNGVNVSDPTRSFTPKEWGKLVEGNHVGRSTRFEAVGAVANVADAVETVTADAAGVAVKEGARGAMYRIYWY